MSEKRSFYEKLTHPKAVKVCVLIAFFTFIPGLIIGVIIASVFGPNGYNIVDNWISDLGSFNTTPTPFILDSIAMVTAILMVPIFLYIKDEFVKIPKEAGSNAKAPLAIKICAYLGLFFMFVGDIGLFGIGLFSEDRNTALNLHMVFSAIVFGGFAIGALFTGFAIIYKNQMLPRQFGYFMVVGPPFATLLFVIDYTDPFISIKLLEWMMLFAIFVWMIPLCVSLIKNLNQKLAQTK